MTMSTPILRSAARLLEKNLFVDLLQVLDVGAPETVGILVIRSTTPVGMPIPGLVQTTTLANAVESRTDSVYSIKVPQGTDLSAGQAVRVVRCLAEPDLEGKALLVDKISKNGLAMLRKGVASDFEVVNQEGKEGIS